MANFADFANFADLQFLLILQILLISTVTTVFLSQFFLKLVPWPKATESHQIKAMAHPKKSGKVMACHGFSQKLPSLGTLPVGTAY